MDRLEFPERIALGFAGLFGLAGVALSAMAAHAANPQFLAQAGLLCLAHAPALIGLAAVPLRTGRAAAWAMIAGTALFTADMIIRNRFGHGLFPMAAPSGGFAMMAGWLLVMAGAFLPRRA